MWQNTWLKSWKRRVFPPKRCTVRCWKIYLPLGSGWLSAQPTVDIPDNLSPFYEALQEQKPDLSAVRFGAIGIGSREYDTFCGAIDKLEAELKNSGAKQTGETLKINILDHDIPEDPAEEWLGSWINLLK